MIILFLLQPRPEHRPRPDLCNSKVNFHSRTHQILRLLSPMILSLSLSLFLSFFFFMKASDIFLPATVGFYQLDRDSKPPPVSVSISFFLSFPFSSSVTVPLSLLPCLSSFIVEQKEKKRAVSFIKRKEVGVFGFFYLHWN